MNTWSPVTIAAGIASRDSDNARSDIENARELVERLAALGRLSTAQMLEELRRAFPNSPLSVRVRALEALRHR